MFASSNTQVFVEFASEQSASKQHVEIAKTRISFNTVTNIVINVGLVSQLIYWLPKTRANHDNPTLNHSYVVVKTITNVRAECAKEVGVRS